MAAMLDGAPGFVLSYQAVGGVREIVEVAKRVALERLEVRALRPGQTRHVAGTTQPRDVVRRPATISAAMACTCAGSMART